LGEVARRAGGGSGTPPFGGEKRGSPLPGYAGTPPFGGEKRGSPLPGYAGTPPFGGRNSVPDRAGLVARVGETGAGHLDVPRAIEPVSRRNEEEREHSQGETGVDECSLNTKDPR
jgi:hypothetical protein